MSDILSQIQAQSAGLSSVDDLRKQAIEQHGIELGAFTGSLNAYRQGRQQIAQFGSTEKIDVVGLTSPITRRLGKAAYEKVLKPGAKSLYEKAKASGRNRGEGEDVAEDPESTEMGDIGGGATRQVPEGSGISDDGQQLEGDFSPENLSARMDNLSPEAQGRADDAFQERTGSSDSIKESVNKSADETDGGMDGKIMDHTEADKAIGTEEDAAKEAASQAEKEAAERAAASAGEKAAAEGAAEEGGALAAESAIPGIGEIAMVGTLFYQLFHSIHKAHKEEADIQKPTAPGAPKLPTVDFDSAPVIDSSGFHAL